MTEIIKESVVTTQTPNGEIEMTVPNERNATGLQSAIYLIYFVFGIVDVILAMRFILKILGANPFSGFVTFIYNLSGILVAPFTGMFRTATTVGAETTSIFEPATLIAILIYGLLAWGIVKLTQLLSGKEVTE